VSKSIVIDYLNFYTIFYVIKNKYKVVHILYKHKYFNYHYEYLLYKLKIEAKYEKLTYSSKNTHIYMKIKAEKEHLINENFSYDDYLSRYLYQRFYFDNIHPIVELKVLFESKKIDYILINYPNYISLLAKKSPSYKKFKYYSLPLFADNKKLVYFNRGTYFNKNKYIFKNTIKALLVIVNLRFSLKKRNRCDILTYSKVINEKKIEDDVNELNWLERSEISYLKLNPLTYYLSNKTEKFHLFTINPIKLTKYIKEVSSIFFNLYKNKNTHFLMYPYLLEQSKNIYFINEIIDTNKLKFIYTCYEGSYLANILNIIGYTNNYTISMCATWSLNYFPQFDSAVYKNSDIFFAWGAYHQNLYLECGSLYRSLVSVGYIGDYSNDSMQLSMEEKILKYRNKHFIIVAVYDNVAGDDGFLTYLHLNDFYKGVLEILKKENYACIIKNKRNTLSKYLDSNLLSDINKYNEKILYIDTLADLGPALVSDFVYAFSMSSLGNVASAFGKKTFLYDENNIVDKNKKYLSKNTSIVHSVSEFIEKVDKKSYSTNIVDVNSGIVSFADGKAQSRILEYVNLILNSKEENKLNKIKEADDAYMLKYGQDKLLINENR